MIEIIEQQFQEKTLDFQNRVNQFLKDNSGSIVTGFNNIMHPSGYSIKSICVQLIKGKEPKVKEVTDSETYKKCVDFWLKELHPDFTFGAKHGKAMKGIIKYLSNLHREGKFTGVEVSELFKLICHNLPEWFKTKDLPIIESKLNEIIAQIKYGNTTKQGQL